MTDILVHRPARAAAVLDDPTPVPLAAPPAVEQGQRSASWTYALFPLLGSAGILVFALVNGNPVYLIAGGVFVLGSVGMGAAMLLTMRGRSAEQKLGSRERYLEHLADARTRLQEAAHAQQELARQRHPAPEGLVTLVGAPGRLWERRPADDDFLSCAPGWPGCRRRPSRTCPSPTRCGRPTP